MPQNPNDWEDIGDWEDVWEPIKDFTATDLTPAPKKQGWMEWLTTPDTKPVNIPENIPWWQKIPGEAFNQFLVPMTSPLGTATTMAAPLLGPLAQVAPRAVGAGMIGFGGYNALGATNDIENMWNQGASVKDMTSLFGHTLGATAAPFGARLGMAGKAPKVGDVTVEPPIGPMYDQPQPAGSVSRQPQRQIAGDISGVNNPFIEGQVIPPFSNFQRSITGNVPPPASSGIRGFLEGEVPQMGPQPQRAFPMPMQQPKQLPAIGGTANMSDPRFYQGMTGMADEWMAYPYMGKGTPDIGAMQAADRRSIFDANPVAADPVMSALVPPWMMQEPEVLPWSYPVMEQTYPTGAPNPTIPQSTLQHPPGGAVVNGPFAPPRQVNPSSRVEPFVGLNNPMASRPPQVPPAFAGEFPRAVSQLPVSDRTFRPAAIEAPRVRAKSTLPVEAEQVFGPGTSRHLGQPESVKPVPVKPTNGDGSFSWKLKKEPKSRIDMIRQLSSDRSLTDTQRLQVLKAWEADQPSMAWAKGAGGGRIPPDSSDTGGFGGGEGAFAGGVARNPNEASLAAQIYESTRTLMASDAPFMNSMAFRQAAPLTFTREWLKAFVPQVKAYGAKIADNNIFQAIHADPLVAPDATGKSFMKDIMKVKFASDSQGVNHAEETMLQTLAEKIPFLGTQLVKRSNKAGAAFLDSLRLERTKTMIGALKANGFDPEVDQTLAAELGKLINDFTGRPELSLALNPRASGGKWVPKEISLESARSWLSKTLFSPNTIARNVKTLNPMTYAQTPAPLRRERMNGLIRQVGAWWGLAGLADMMGADVNYTDPTSPDFGKIRYGNVRLDPGAGLQQFLVLGAQTAMGGRTSTSKANEGKFMPFTGGFGQESVTGNMAKFFGNRVHPTIGLFAKGMNAALGGQDRFGTLDQTLQSTMPMYISDLAELAKSDNTVAQILGIPMSVLLSAGAQDYSGKFNDPVFIPQEYDFNLGGKK